MSVNPAESYFFINEYEHDSKNITPSTDGPFAINVTRKLSHLINFEALSRILVNKTPNQVLYPKNVFKILIMFTLLKQLVDCTCSKRSFKLIVFR
jgi:hypothetical protein